MTRPQDYIELQCDRILDFIPSELYLESPELNNPYVGLDNRPKGVEPQDNEWKNRHRISAKLTRCNFVDGYKFCRKKGWSWSTGINYLLTTHPEIQKIQKDLKNDA